MLQVDETDVEPKDIELVMQQANVSKPKVRGTGLVRLMGVDLCADLIGNKSFEE